MPNAKHTNVNVFLTPYPHNGKSNYGSTVYDWAIKLGASLLVQLA